MLALERDDNPSSNNRHGQSQCNILIEVSDRIAVLRVDLNHVHTKDGLFKIELIIIKSWRSN